jgi:hypothetical protein
MRTVNGIKTGKVVGEVRTKTVGTSRQVSEWSMSLYAGKNADGTYKRAYVTCKAWDIEPPQRGDEISVNGELQAEVWYKDGKESSKVVIVVESFGFVVERTEETSQHGQDLPF